MCGVICRFSVDPSNSFKDALGVISHRGPDSNGYKRIDIGNKWCLELGHVRLSILDTNVRSAQPFSLDDSNFLIFNGELYNYKELAHEFLSKIELVTTSDTEVLWYLLKIYGVEILANVVGMYSIIYYDGISKNLVVSRDYLGIKPLYYGQNDSEIFFCSEIKGIKALGFSPLVDLSSLPEYLQFGYLHEPKTGFKNISKVLPGEVISISLPSIDFKRKQIPNVVNSIQNFREIIDYSLRIHQRADVKQTLFFSGGIDSSILLDGLDASTVKPLVWVNNSNELKEAGFSNDYYFAKQILAHLGRDFIEVADKDSGSDFLESLKEMVKGIEELTCDYTYISSLRLSRLAREKGFIVAHSGMGADEIFGGYPRYLAFKYILRYRKLLKLLTPIINLAKSKTSQRLVSAINAKNELETYTSLICYFTKNEMKDLIGKEYFTQLELRKNQLWSLASSSTPLKTAMSLDFIGFLSHNFIVADKSSMQASIEMRIPLANQLTMGWFMQSKDSDLIRGTKTKVSLRKILYSRINKKFFKRKKAGFNPPMDKKINELGISKLKDIMSKTNWYGILDEKVVDQIITNHFKKTENNTYKIVNLLFLKFWLEDNVVEL